MYLIRLPLPFKNYSNEDIDTKRAELKFNG